jgi:DHA1 family tetracycline resistance protein-like MFS transporter
MLPIFMIVLVDVLGLTIILPLLPFYAEHYGASPFVVGLLASSYAACQLFSGPLLGHWSDRIGRKPLLLLSQLGTFLGFLLLAFANSLWMIFVSRIIDGMTAGNISLAQAYISDVTEPKNRASAFAKIGMAFGIGFFIGPALSGLLAGHGYQYPIFAAAGLSALSMIATMTLLPKAKKSTEPKSELSHWETYFGFFKQPVLKPLLIQVSLFFLAFSFYVSGLALFAERRFVWGGHSFGPREVGYIYAYSGFLGIVIQGFVFKRLVSKLGEKKLARIGFASGAIGYLIVGVIHSPFWIVLTGILGSFFNAVVRPTLTSLVSQNVDRRQQGLVMGMMQSIMSVAQIIMPAIGALFIQYSYLTLWAWVPAALTGGALLFATAESRRVPAAQPAS